MKRITFIRLFLLFIVVLILSLLLLGTIMLFKVCWILGLIIILYLIFGVWYSLKEF